MNETKFLELSENELIKLSDLIENNDFESVFDVEYSDGILTIEIFDSSEQYVINKHSASQKIWFSSPKSGANYFAYDESKAEWLSDDGAQLQDFLIAQLTTNFNFNIKND